MKSYDVFLPCYSVGPDCYRVVPRIARRFGTKAVVIGGKTAMAKARGALLDAVEGSGLSVTDFVWYGGNSTYENVEALTENPAVRGADIIFGVGGGRAVDTSKVVCDRLGKPLFAFPTIASNCASCTAIAVIYHQDGTLQEYYTLKTPPDHTFIHTGIIAQAPETLFWAGIGDALSKEPEVLLATRGAEMFHTLLVGAQLSRACGAPLFEYGLQALRDCRAGKVSFALEQVVLDIIVSTGLVSNLTSSSEYYYNSSLAHCFYNSVSLAGKAGAHLHGEIVSFGILCLLACDNRPEELEKYAEFNLSLGLPVCLGDLDLSAEDLPAILEKAPSVTEWKCVPYPMTKERFENGILRADALGQKLKVQAKARLIL